MRRLPAPKAALLLSPLLTMTSAGVSTDLAAKLRTGESAIQPLALSQQKMFLVDSPLLLASADRYRQIRPGREFSGRHSDRKMGSHPRQGHKKRGKHPGGGHDGGRHDKHKNKHHHRRHDHSYSGIWISPYYWGSRWGYGWNNGWGNSWTGSWNDPRYSSRDYYDRAQRQPEQPKTRVITPPVTSAQSALPRGGLASLPANARVLHTESGTRYRWQERCYRFDWQRKLYLETDCPKIQ